MVLYYFGARYYDPEIGIFTSTDPMGEYFFSYSYTGGNPIMLVDPSGMLDFVFQDADGNVTYEHYDPEIWGEGLIWVNNGKGMLLSESNPQNSFSIFSRGFPGQFSLINIKDRPNPIINTFPAWTGRESGIKQTVIGNYIFTTDAIQNFSDLSIAQQGASLVGKGQWPGGTVAWGRSRVELTPYPSTAARIKGAGRTGHFFIHGGDFPGSGGCIDLMHSEQTYLRAVPGGLHTVYVR